MMLSSGLKGLISKPIKSLLLGMKCVFNPLSPHDALKHHYTSLKTDLISLQLGVLERKFPCNWFTNAYQFSLIF